jgi:hypothetical protein
VTIRHELLPYPHWHVPIQSGGAKRKGKTKGK